jgi:hypothetical protein
MEREETAVRDLFARVDEVLDVAHSIEGERPQEAARLVHVSHGALSSARPVRVPIAARILLVSDKTVRAWVEEGVLTSRAVRPRLVLDAERLHTVLRFLGDLRAAGQERDFRDDLWNRLRDEALLDRPDLAESLSQMNTGDVCPALTFDEERVALLADAAPVITADTTKTVLPGDPVPGPGVLHEDAVREPAVGTCRVLLDLRLDLSLQVDAGHRRKAEKVQRHVRQLLADSAALLAPGIERLRDLTLQ